MNYLGAEPARYQLEIHNILLIYKLFGECPPSKGQRGMILYGSEPRYSQYMTQIVIPQLTPFASPFKGGLFNYFPTQRVGELNHL